MDFVILSLFPEWFAGPLGDSVIGRARANGLLNLRIVNPRDFAEDKHQTVDDAPYGGGGGMVLRADVLARALDAAIGPPGASGRGHVAVLSPRGRPFTQDVAREFAGKTRLTLICGHYEAIDQRFIDLRADEELSLGDFVMTGGEIAAMAVADATARLIPGVLGNSESAPRDSFMTGLLEGPHYTRPEEFEGHSVPDVLKSGNHAAIDDWRLEQAILLTRQRRPELLGEWVLHPSQIERIARRGRPIAVWKVTGGSPQLIFASRKVRPFATVEALCHWRAEAGVTNNYRYCEVKQARGESASQDRQELLEDLRKARDTSGPETRAFLQKLESACLKHLAK